MALFGRKEPENEVVDDVSENLEDEVDETPEEKPAFVTVDQMQAMIEAQGKQMQETLQTLLTPAAAPAVAQEPQFVAEVSDDDILEALEQDDHKKVLQLQKQQRLRDKQIAEHQMNQLRNEGSQWIGNVNQKLAEEKLTDYGKYKKEIDGVLATFPAHLRADEGIIEFVYNSIRGKHMDEEVNARAKAMLEAQKRQANGEPDSGDPSPGARRRTANNRYYEEDEPYFSREVDDTIRAAGRSHDEQARRLGYDSWEAYTEMAKEYDTKPVHKWATGSNR